MSPLNVLPGAEVKNEWSYTSNFVIHVRALIGNYGRQHQKHQIYVSSATIKPPKGIKTYF